MHSVIATEAGNGSQPDCTGGRVLCQSAGALARPADDNSGGRLATYISCGGEIDRRTLAIGARPRRCDTPPQVVELHFSAEEDVSCIGKAKSVRDIGRQLLWQTLLPSCAQRSIRPESQSQVAQMTGVIATDASGDFPRPPDPQTTRTSSVRSLRSRPSRRRRRPSVTV